MAWEIVGWVGALALLAAYGLLALDRLQATSVAYVAFNLGGSAGLALNGAVHGAWPSTALNLLWLAIGLVALVRRRHVVRRRNRSTPGDRRL